MATWFTADEARDQWVDAPLDDDYLEELLEVARGAVLAYAPAVPDVEPVTIPTSYRQAQIMQARNVFNASKAAPGGEFDGSSYGITTHPLDWQIKQLLRPRTVFGGPVG